MPNAKGWRTRKDPRTGDMVQLGDIVDGLMREEVFSRGIPIAELASKWPQIVGERLAAETAPTALEGAVLTVSATNGPWGAQARFLHEQIRAEGESSARLARSSQRFGSWCETAGRWPETACETGLLVALDW